MKREQSYHVHTVQHCIALHCWMFVRHRPSRHLGIRLIDDRKHCDCTALVSFLCVSVRPPSPHHAEYYLHEAKRMKHRADAMVSP